MRQVRKVAKRHDDQIDCLNLREIDLLIEVAHIEIGCRAIGTMPDVAHGDLAAVDLGGRERGHVGLPMAIVARQDRVATSGEEQRNSQSDA